MTDLTPGQQAQQNNRTVDGKYTTRQHAEADFTPPTSVALAVKARRELLVEALEKAEKAEVAAKKHLAYVTGQMTLERIRDHIPNCAEMRFAPEEPWGGDVKVQLVGGDGVHIPRATWPDDVDDILLDVEGLRDVWDPYQGEEAIRYDPDGENEPQPVSVTAPQSRGNADLLEAVDAHVRRTNPDSYRAGRVRELVNEMADDVQAQIRKDTAEATERAYEQWANKISGQLGAEHFDRVSLRAQSRAVSARPHTSKA